jgi:AcrR family transcriptional regulator
MPTRQSTHTRESGRAKRLRAGRPPLSTRTELLDAALRVIDGYGLAALSMKRVAEELGIGVMTVYGYVETKDELVEAVTRHALSALTATPMDGPPITRLTAAIHSLYTTLREHAGVLEVLLNGPVPGAALDPLREDLLSMLGDMGVSGAPAMDALSILYSYAVGFAVTERSLDRQSNSDGQRRVENLSAQRFPHLSAAAQDYASRLSPRAFETGLHNLITAIAAPQAGEHQ